MKALKTLVIGMGLLIVLGLCLVGYGMTRSRPTPPATPGTAETAPATSSASAAVFATQYPAPKGMKLEQVSTVGDRILLRFTGMEGDKLVLIDPHTGRMAGVILLTPDSK